MPFASQHLTARCCQNFPVASAVHRHGVQNIPEDFEENHHKMFEPHRGQDNVAWPPSLTKLRSTADRW